MDVFHIAYELQTLAKLQRAFDQDIEDVGAMLARGLTSKASISAAFDQMRGDLFRFPAVDEDRLAQAVTSLPTAPPAESVQDA